MMSTSEKSKLRLSLPLNISPNMSLKNLFKSRKEKEMLNQAKVKILARAVTSQTLDRFRLVKIQRIDLSPKNKRTRSNKHAQVEHSK